MDEIKAKAIASPNIAFIKYWGNFDQVLRIPANPSLSMTLGGLETSTHITLLEPGANDVLVLNGESVTGPPQARVTAFLDVVRSISNHAEGVRVESINNFPSGAGIASSAAAFAALSIAANSAFDLSLSPESLSRLARRGSGSAARSIFGGYVELSTGSRDEDSYAQQIFDADHWHLEDWIAVIDPDHKSTGSTEGHKLAETSPIQAARIDDTPRRVQICRNAIENRDFASFAEVVEQDSNLMHAVMITSEPSLLYLQPASLLLMQSIKSWRREGLHACFTIDAGPNVHVLCTAESSDEVERRLREFDVIRDLIHAVPGQGAQSFVDLAL